MTMKKKIIYRIVLSTTLLLTGCSSSNEEIPSNSEDDDLIIETIQEKPTLVHSCEGTMPMDNGKTLTLTYGIYENKNGEVEKVVSNVNNGEILTNEQIEKTISNYMDSFDLPREQFDSQTKDGKTIIVTSFTFNQFNKHMDNIFVDNKTDTVFSGFKQMGIFSACDGVSIETSSSTPNTSQSNSSVPASGIRPEFKEMMDNFVVFYQQYADFMNNADPNSSDYYTKYIEVMQQYTDTMAAMEKVEDMDMNTDEMKYYLEKMAEIQQILATVQTN